MLGTTTNPSIASSSLLRRRTFKRDQLNVDGAPPAPHRHHAHRMTTVFSGRALQNNHTPRNSWHRHSLGAQPQRHSFAYHPHRLSATSPQIHTHIRQSSTRPPRPLSLKPFLSRVSHSTPKAYAPSKTATTPVAPGSSSTIAPDTERRGRWRKSTNFTKLRPVSTLGKLSPTATLGKLRPVSTLGRLRPSSTFGRTPPPTTPGQSLSQPASPARGGAKHSHRRTLSDGVRSLFHMMQRRPRDDLMEDTEAEEQEADSELPPLSGITALTFSAPLRPHRSPDADSFLVTSPSPDRDTFDTPLWRTSSPSPLSPRYSTASISQDRRRPSLIVRTHRRVSDLRMADRLESRFSDSSSDEDDSDDESLTKLKLAPPKAARRLSLNILRRRKGLSAPTFRGHFQAISPEQRGKSCEL